MKSILTALVFVALSLTSIAKDNKANKAKNAIKVLLETQTILTLDSMRTAMILNAKSIKEEIKNGEINKSDANTLRTKYDLATKSFNDIIYQFQNHLLDRTKRRTIIDDPETYESSMSNKIAEAKQIYSNEFLAYYDQLNDKTAVCFLCAIWTAAWDIYKTVKNIMSDIANMKREFIEENFTNKVLFPTWDKIQ